MVTSSGPMVHGSVGTGYLVSRVRERGLQGTGVQSTVYVVFHSPKLMKH